MTEELDAVNVSPKKTLHVSLLALFIVVTQSRVQAASGETVQARMEADVEAGRPLLAHVVVALCDNKHQGIQRVSESLGNGQNPRWNLYWGALLGVKTYLPKHGGWEVVSRSTAPGQAVLERMFFHRKIPRGNKTADAYIVADAWDGKEIKPAIRQFLSIAAGHNGETVEIGKPDRNLKIQAGGAAHLVAFVGHNGLMDFQVSRIPNGKQGALPRSSIVLACRSKPYFLEFLRRGGSHPLLLTTGLMAPEAYTLDAAVRTWFAGKSTTEVQEAAGAAYHKYQDCGLRAATRLFSVEP